jgi:3-phenylpropionate/trans-cinnamate dioxygenase ferredoxin subunit
VTDVRVCALSELPPGSVKVIEPQPDLPIGVFNAGGELFAIEDRCSHDDGPLCEGDWEPDRCVVICPRHGANFDIRTGKALTLPAYIKVDTYPVKVVGDDVFVELP